MSFTGFFLKQALYVWKCNSFEVSLWAYKIVPTHIWLCPTVGLEPRWPERTANVSQSLSLFPRAKSEGPIQSSTAIGQAGPSVFSPSDGCAGVSHRGYSLHFPHDWGRGAALFCHPCDFLRGVTCSSAAPRVWLGCLFSSCWVFWVLYIFWVEVLCQTGDFQIFFPCSWLLFSFS